MTLGQTLKGTLDTLAAQNLRESDARDAETLRKQQAERKKHSDLVQKLMDHISEKITQGAVPDKKIENYDAQSWIRQAAKGTAKHSDLWADFVSWLKVNDLALDLREDHDGVGIRSWITVRVKPV